MPFRIADVGDGEPMVRCTEMVDEEWAGVPGGGFVGLGYGRDCRRVDVKVTNVSFVSSSMHLVLTGSADVLAPLSLFLHGIILCSSV